MRSETAPTWVGFAIGFGVALIVVALFALAKGEMRVVSSVTFRRDTQPGAFWAAVVVSGCTRKMKRRQVRKRTRRS